MIMTGRSTVMVQITKNALPIYSGISKTAWAMNLIEFGTMKCMPWYRRRSITGKGFHLTLNLIWIKFLSSKKGTMWHWKRQKKNMSTFRQVITIGMVTICIFGWKNICRIISCSCTTIECQPPTMKPKGYWENINESNSKLWHFGVKRVSSISVSAWACLLWCYLSF